MPASRFLLGLAVLLLAACGGATTSDAGGMDAATADSSGIDATTDLGPGHCTDDADGDSHRSIACGGDDCDDTDANRYPGHAEVCDSMNHDEDCEPSTFGFRDSDSDGYGDIHCCNGTTCGTDCDDANGNIHPMQTETCNLVDDNCNGMIDEGAAGPSYWPDCDGDSFGAMSATPMMGCTAPATPPTCGTPMGTPGWATNGTDCNDATAMVHPGAAGTCDCTAGGGDADHDGHLGVACGGDDCDDSNAATYHGATEVCDGADNDCDGRPDYPLSSRCVPCAMSGCSAGGCCSSLSSPMCRADASSCTGTPFGFFAECDGPEDCAPGGVCCAGMYAGQASCGTPATCMFGSVPLTICHVTSDCPAGQTCPTAGGRCA